MGFGKIFWGIIFLIFNFKIQRFDIAPDFIGYILIYLGLSKLSLKNFHFDKGKKFALSLSIISIIFGLFIFNKNTLDFPFLISLLTNIGILVLNAFLIYFICMGISEIALDLNRRDLANMAHERWKYYLYMIYANIFISIFAFLIPPLAIVFIIPLAIAALIIMILIASLVKKAENIEYLLYDNEYENI